MHRALVVSAKIAALSACMAGAIALAGSATASAAPLTATPASASYAAFFFGSGTNIQQAAAQAEFNAADAGYFSCAIVSTSEFPGIFGPTYSVTVGCNRL